MKPRSPASDLAQPVRPTLPMCGHCKSSLTPTALYCGFCGEPVDVPSMQPTVRVLDRHAAGTGQMGALPGVVTVKPGERPERMLERTLVDEHPPAFDPATTKKMIEELQPGTTVGEWRIE